MADLATPIDIKALLQKKPPLKKPASTKPAELPTNSQEEALNTAKIICKMKEIQSAAATVSDM